MRWLFGGFLVLVAAWSGYWFVGSSLIERETRAFFVQTEASGTAGADDVTVEGFANRFDLTVDAPWLRQPETGLGWSAHAAKVHAMTWKPWHIILSLPEMQKITLPYSERVIELGSKNFAASLRGEPSLDLALVEFRVTADSLSLKAADADLALTADTLAFALRAAPQEGSIFPYDLGLNIAGIAPPSSFLTALQAVYEAGGSTAAPSELPSKLERLHIDIGLGLTGKLDKTAIEVTPQLSSLNLRDISVIWGDLQIKAEGQISADAKGFPKGRIDLEVQNWQHLPVILGGTGLLPAEHMATAEKILASAAGASGEENLLKIPFIFQDGQVRMSIFPLGPVPKILR